METSGSDRIPGAAAEASDALPKHTMIGEFEIIGVVGEGGFGTVYLAIDHSLQRKVALKEYRPSLLATRHGKSVMVRSQRHADAFEAGLKSFMNEARTLARFDHPALIHVYRVWQQNNTAYMAMPLCEGRSLTIVIQDDPEIATQSWVMSMMMPLLEAVATLHGSNIYHRDIAPDNVVIQDNGAPMLLDFGAARQIATDRTQALTVILKPGYAPIEQFADDPSMRQGPWTDIYALGATMYFAITGRPPPNAVARLAGDPMVPLAGALGGAYAPEFLDAIDKALAVRPKDRPQSVAEFRALLNRIPHAVVPRVSTPPLVVNGVAVTASTIAPLAGAGALSDQPILDAAPQTLVPERVVSKAAPDPAVPGEGASRTAPDSMSPTVPASPAAGSSPAPPGPPAPSVPREPAMAGLSRATRAFADRAAGATRAAAARLAPVVRSHHGLQIGAGAAAILVLVLAVALVRNPFAPPQAPVEKEAESDRPASASASVPASAPGSVEVPASPVTTTAARPGEVATSASGTTAAKDTSTATAAQAAAPAAAEPAAGNLNGTLAFAIRPWGEVIVNGENKGPSPPLKRIAVPEGTYRIVTNPGFASFTTDVQIGRNKSITVTHQFK